MVHLLLYIPTYIILDKEVKKEVLVRQIEEKEILLKQLQEQALDEERKSELNQETLGNFRKSNVTPQQQAALKRKVQTDRLRKDGKKYSTKSTDK